MNTGRKTDESRYNSGQLNRPTTASSFNSTTVIRYIAPRILGLNLSNSFQGSVRNFALSNGSSSFTMTPLTNNHGLASLVYNSTASTISPIHSINGERAIDEHRELSKLTETLTENILRCCHLDAYNRAIELQLNWLQTHSNKNSITIEKMFKTEIQTARQLNDEASRYKSSLEKKLNDLHQTTLANDEQYQHLLSKRNAVNEELFNYQRQLAQTRAESEFLRARLEQFKQEIQFYTLKNNTLQARQIKLRYELDEEIFSKQVLQMEHEILQNEKITKEDIRVATTDDIRGSIDVNQIATMQPSTYYLEQLNHQVRRMRLEYESKIEIHRNELHRKLELELHRYQMHKVRPIPTVTREHEQKIELHKREKKDTEQQIGFVRGNIHQVEIHIKTLERQIYQEKQDTESILNSQRHLTMLEKIINEREKQLNEAIRVRTALKQQIENYREEVHRFQVRDSYGIKQSSVTTKRESILRLSSQEIQQAQPVTPRLPQNIRSVSPSSRREQLASSQVEDRFLEKGTLVRFADFNVERDCEELNEIFNKSQIDEVDIIRLLCNRSVAQRLHIRDTYKNRFGQNLINTIETEINGNSKKILKLLLLSPIERDCYELRRVLKGTNIDENILIEIFLCRSNKEIRTISDSYQKSFQSTLEQDIIGDRDTHSKRIVLSLLRANRPEDGEVDDDESKEDAQKIYQTSSKWKTDGSTFIRLLCDRSNAHLKQVFADYPQFSGVDIEQSIKLDIDSDLSRTLMAIVRLVRNRPRFFAYELRKSLKGANTNEDNLNRIIISRCEIDMMQIKSEYEKIAKRTLYDHIQTDTNGNYKRVLLELLRQRIEPNNKELSFKQFLEPPELPKKQNPDRTSVQLREPVNKQSFGRSINDRNVNVVKQIIQFDRNNQAKSNTLSTINENTSRSQYLDRTSSATTFGKYLQSNND